MTAVLVCFAFELIGVKLVRLCVDLFSIWVWFLGVCVLICFDLVCIAYWWCIAERLYFGVLWL